jgi:hypothetical protein
MNMESEVGPLTLTALVERSTVPILHHARFIEENRKAWK